MRQRGKIKPQAFGPLRWRRWGEGYMFRSD
jgi:hypothetical protein